MSSREQDSLDEGFPCGEAGTSLSKGTSQTRARGVSREATLAHRQGSRVGRTSECPEEAGLRGEHPRSQNEEVHGL